MSRKTEKKSRGPNFSSNEKDILIHLITKYKDIVENKRTDATTTSIKNEGWAKITEEFNSVSSFSARNTEQLKTCWDNIKRNTRKDNALVKKELLRTGGGMPNIPPMESYHGQVEVILGPTLSGLENVFDSDAQYLLHNDNSISLENETENSNIIVTETSVCPQDYVTNQENESSAVSQTSTSKEDKCLMKAPEERKTWHGWSPAALKTKVSTNLAKQKDSPSWLHRRRPKGSLQDGLLQSKIELVELMKKSTESETNLKNQILEEQLRQEKLKTLALELKLKEPN